MFKKILIFLTLMLLMLTAIPDAGAEQNRWDFAFTSSGLGGSTVNLYGSQNFPDRPVLPESTFNAFLTFSVSDTSVDIEQGALTVEGCSLISDEAQPGTNNTNWYSEVIQIRMNTASCSITRTVVVVDSGTILYNHTFAFSVSSFEMIELGQNPEDNYRVFFTGLGLILFFIIIARQEQTVMGAGLLYLIAIVSAIVTTISIWDQMVELRVIIIGLGLYCAGQIAVLVSETTREMED